MSFDRLREFDLLYLSTPYSKYEAGINAAFKEASRIAGRLAIAGVKVYCPIAASHAMSIYAGIDPKDHEFWMRFDEPFMNLSGAIVVARMKGWQVSDGVAEEIDRFEKADKPVFFLNPKTMEID